MIRDLLAVIIAGLIVGFILFVVESLFSGCRREPSRVTRVPAVFEDQGMILMKQRKAKRVLAWDYKNGTWVWVPIHAQELKKVKPCAQ